MTKPNTSVTPTQTAASSGTCGSTATVEAATQRGQVERWNEPKEISNLEVAFPANVTGKFLPPYSIIPDQFKRGHTHWNKVMNEWFFKGLDPKTLIPKEGIDKDKALRQLKACLGSFEPKHEHKEAGVAYLMSLFFVEPGLSADTKDTSV